jgi:hypothetical protein
MEARGQRHRHVHGHVAARELGDVEVDGIIGHVDELPPHAS